MDYGVCREGPSLEKAAKIQYFPTLNALDGKGTKEVGYEEMGHMKFLFNLLMREWSKGITIYPSTQWFMNRISSISIPESKSISFVATTYGIYKQENQSPKLPFTAL